MCVIISLAKVTIKIMSVLIRQKGGGLTTVSKSDVLYRNLFLNMELAYCWICLDPPIFAVQVAQQFVGIHFSFCSIR